MYAHIFVQLHLCLRRHMYAIRAPTCLSAHRGLKAKWAAVRFKFQASQTTLSGGHVYAVCDSGRTAQLDVEHEGMVFIRMHLVVELPSLMSSMRGWCGRSMPCVADAFRASSLHSHSLARHLSQL